MSGGFALIDDRAHLLAVEPFPTKREKAKTKLDGVALAKLARGFNATHAFIENVTSRPRQAGQFQFGINTGVLHGIMYANDIPMTLVSPVLWKASFGLQRAETETKREKKDEARKMVQGLYPDQAHYFDRVKDDGVAEAVLIALYGLYLITQT